MKLHTGLRSIVQEKRRHSSAPTKSPHPEMSADTRRPLSHIVPMVSLVPVCHFPKLSIRKKAMTDVEFQPGSRDSTMLPNAVLKTWHTQFQASLAKHSKLKAGIQ